MQHKITTGLSIVLLLAVPSVLATEPALIPVQPLASATKPLKIGKVDISFGGFFKLDALFSSFSDGDLASLDAGRDFFRPNSIPVAASSPAEQSHHFLDVHAKDTRFFLKTVTAVEGHELGGYLEMDFRSSPGGNEVNTNSFNPRMRRAYLTYDGWLAGQEWSLMRNTDASPDHIDDIRGPTQALVIVRQPQIRYTAGAYQFGLENSETNLLPRNGTRRGTAAVRNPFVTGDSRFPDLTLRYNLDADAGKFSVTALVRLLAANEAETGGDAPNAKADGSALGSGINLSGKIPLSGGDDVRFSFTSGDGIGRYLALATAPDAVVDEQGGLQTIRTTAGYVSYRHPWTPRWRSTFTLAHLSVDQPPELTGLDVTRSVNSAHGNLLYSPVEKLTAGVELMHAIRELENAQEGSLTRLQFSAKYEW